MTNQISFMEQFSFLVVFLEGLLSFFSPCVLPLIPIYMGCLCGSGRKKAEDGSVAYHRPTVLLHTLFFILGVSLAFFALGFSFSSALRYLNQNKTLFSRIGGILILVLGLFQLGVFRLPFLQRERKFHFLPDNEKMNPLMALLTGFFFSFAWTPCIGPALSSVLILASNTDSTFYGNFLIFVYTLGFVIPFLLLGIFTAQVLNFFRNNQKILQYTVKIGGILLVIVGLSMATGVMNRVSNFLTSQVSVSKDASDPSLSNETKEEAPPAETPKEENDTHPTIPAFDFTLTDQYGNTHTLSDYKGKVVFLNFWATWCGFCKAQMPDIEKIYEEYGYNEEDVIILGVANPNGLDGTKEEINAYLTENGYTFPVVFDETGEVLANYAVTAFPITYMINADGNIYGYVPGAMSKDVMIDVITQTQENKGVAE